MDISTTEIAHKLNLTNQGVISRAKRLGIAKRYRQSYYGRKERYFNPLEADLIINQKSSTEPEPISVIYVHTIYHIYESKINR